MASPDHAATVRAFLDNCVPGLTTPDVADAQAALDALIAALARVEHERDAARSRLRDAPRGGAGSHWDGCHLSHIDCANVRRERAERQRDQAIEALRTIHTSPICFIDCTERVGAVLATLDPDAAT